MYFDKIPDGISGPGGPGEINSGPVDRTQRKSVETDEQKQQETRKAADATNLSVDAQELARYQELVRLHREAFGESSREDRLATVRQRVESGYYDDPQAMDQLAEKLVEGAVRDAGSSQDLETARRRADEGYYDRPEVVDRTAENMLRRVWPKDRG